MRRQVVTSSRTQKKRVERVYQGFASSFFVGQSLSLCSSDLPLCGTFVELAKELIQLGTEIKAMEAISLGQTHARMRDGAEKSRTDLDVFPSFGGSCGFK